MDAPPPNTGGSQPPFSAPPPPQGPGFGAPPPQAPPPKKDGSSVWKILGIGCGAIVLIGIIGTIYAGKKIKDFASTPEAAATACNLVLAVALDDANEFKNLKGAYPKDENELAAAPLKQPFSKEALDIPCQKWSIKSTDNGKGVLIEGTPKNDQTGGKCVISYTHDKGMSTTPECPKLLLK